MTRSLKYHEVHFHLNSHYGGKVVKKSSSMLMRWIDTLLRIITLGQMTTFLTNFVTTIGSTVYVTEGWDDRDEVSRSIVLRHEMVHIEQKNRMGMLLFSLYYLFWPLPAVYAIGRKNMEQEAYEETMYGWAQARGLNVLEDDVFKEGILRNFLGPSYFWMYPFRAKLETWYEEAAARVREELRVPTPMI